MPSVAKNSQPHQGVLNQSESSVEKPIPMAPSKKSSEETEYSKRLNKLVSSGKTDAEISVIFYNEAIPLAELKGERASEIKKLAFVEKVHCSLPATLYINASKWNSIGCSEKISAINQLGRYCGKLTFFVNSQEISKGFGTWSLEDGAAVFGSDNCGKIH